MLNTELYIADIYLVGLGIFEMRQVTVETLEILKEAQQVFHLTSKHQDLQAMNPNTLDLGHLYWRPEKDWDVYTDIAEHVVGAALMMHPVVFAVDGNPMFFNDICWQIATIGRSRGLRVQALPALSSLDIMPIQLGFDIGDIGVQVFEATQLVLLC